MDLAQQKGTNVRSSDGICMQEEENADWNNGAACMSPSRRAGQAEHLSPGDFSRGCHLDAFPLRLVQEIHKEASFVAQSVSIILQEVSLVLVGQVQRSHTHMARRGNELQAWYRGLLLLRHLFCTPYVC